jgi:hypothetical protein
LTLKVLALERRRTAVAVGMPDEGQLPPGPRRELTRALHGLYVAAGAPGLRRISGAILERDDLNGTVSHEAIRAILNGSLAQWVKIECLVSQLLTWSVSKPDTNFEIAKIHQLWLVAAREMGHLELPQYDERTLPDEATPYARRSAHNGPGQNTAGDDAPDPVHPTERRGSIRRPLISWNPRTGTIDVFDRQMAIQIIQEIRRSDE